MAAQTAPVEGFPFWGRQQRKEPRCGDRARAGWGVQFWGRREIGRATRKGFKIMGDLVQGHRARTKQEQNSRCLAPHSPGCAVLYVCVCDRERLRESYACIKDYSEYTVWPSREGQRA